MIDSVVHSRKDSNGGRVLEGVRVLSGKFSFEAQALIEVLRYLCVLNGGVPYANVSPWLL